MQTNKPYETIKTVCIPSCANHQGIYATTVKLLWRCPICGRYRGEIKKVKSYDGSAYVACDGWDNPCGHVDKYEDVLNEAFNNGLNDLSMSFEVQNGSKKV